MVPSGLKDTKETTKCPPARDVDDLGGVEDSSDRVELAREEMGVRVAFGLLQPSRAEAALCRLPSSSARILSSLTVFV